MSGDLHVHVFEGITEDDLREFFSNTFGSKYFAPRTLGQLGDSHYEAYRKIAGTPDIWIGEVSWLKAAVFGDPEKYVPSPVGQIHDIIGEDLPAINEGMITLIGAALDADNSTGYSIAGKDEVLDFLRQHIGKRVFTVSW